MHRRSIAALLAVLALSLPAIARAADDGNVVAPGYRPPPAGSLIVLLPPKPVDPELAPGGPLMLAQLHRQLVAAGYRAAVLDEPNHDLVWRQEVEAAGGIYDPNTGALRPAAVARALTTLAQRVCQETRCSIVVRPRLVMRTATLSGSKAEWDGQVRFQPVSGNFGGTARFDGQTVALSVELTGISPQEGVVFRTLGGSSVPYRNNMVTGTAEMRKDLFATPEETAEGVQLALRPVLGP